MLLTVLFSLRCVIICCMNVPDNVGDDNEIQIFRNDLPFRTCSSSHTFLKFVTDQSNKKNFNFSGDFYKDKKDKCYIYDTDLIHIFDCSVCVNWFWEILDFKFDHKYSNLRKHLKEHGKVNMNLIIKMLYELIPKNATDVERFKMLKLLIFDSVVQNDVEFFW